MYKYSFALGPPLKPLLNFAQKYKQQIDLQITAFGKKYVLMHIVHIIF